MKDLCEVISGILGIAFIVILCWFDWNNAAELGLAKAYDCVLHGHAACVIPETK